MKSRSVVLLVLLAGAILAAAAGLWLPGRDRQPRVAAEDLPEPCRAVAFEQADYIVCEIDPARMYIAVRYAGADGKPYGSLDALNAATRQAGAPVAFAMNAGMYHESMAPVGLLVEDGREVAPLETREGEGNFFLKPNGIFLIDGDGRAAVLETSAYMSEQRRPRFATQSGPMLVVDGQVHPRFLPDGESRYIRNGVGVRADGTVVLTISQTRISLGSFARLFRDELDCPNALFLDGAISALSNGERTLLGGDYPVGPILTVTAPADGK